MKIMFGAAMVIALISASLAQALSPQTAPGVPPSAGASPRLRPPEVVPPGLPIDLAVVAAKAAVASCVGFHVGVAILDQSGLTKLYYTPDGSAGNHVNVASRKANSALLIKAPSEGLDDRAAADPAIADKVKADKDSGAKTLMSLAGGLPIVVNGEVIGAIGVAGAPISAKDEECAAAGLRAVQSQLK